ncbi:hypothetical protein MAFF212519_13860 [Clavibacter michiganensis]
MRLVQRRRELDVRGILDRDDGPQRDLDEVPAAVVRLPHGAGGLVAVAHDHDARRGGRVQVAEQVALRERGDEGLLGVPAVDVAAERAVGGSQEVGLPRGADDVVAAVGAVVGRAGSAVARPLEGQGVPVLDLHGITLANGAAVLPDPAARAGKLAGS